MMMGIVASIRSLIFGTLMLFIMLTVCSVLAVTFVRPVNRQLYEEGAYGDCTFCEYAFDSVMNSNLTFLSSIVAGDSWGMLAIPLVHADATSAAIILGAFVVINLGLLNTIAAVLVDRQAQARQNDHEYMSVLQSEELVASLDSLASMFEEMDSSDDQALNIEEVMSYYDSNQLFRSILNRMDIHKSDLPVIFDILDTDNTGDLQFNEFVHGLHALKNENSHTLAVFTKYYAEKMFAAWPEIKQMLRLSYHQNEMLRGSLQRLGSAEVLGPLPQPSLHPKVAPKAEAVASKAADLIDYEIKSESSHTSAFEVKAVRSTVRSNPMGRSASAASLASVGSSAKKSIASLERLSKGPAESHAAANERKEQKDGLATSGKKEMARSRSRRSDSGDFKVSFDEGSSPDLHVSFSNGSAANGFEHDLAHMAAQLEEAVENSRLSTRRMPAGKWQSPPDYAKQA